MKKILIIGAGRSAVCLIEYLLRASDTYGFSVTVADSDLTLAKRRVADFSNGKAMSLNILESEQRRDTIKKHDFIISMLPAHLHMEVALDCLTFGKHLATASYVSEGMKKLNDEIKRKNLFFLNECGLDPGIDHASAMKIIDHLHDEGAVIHTFKSYCGGLVAPESNDNPWGYKFSWNPRNVILAGQGVAQYLLNGEMRFIPYNRLFTQTEQVEVDGFGQFDAYANRDSLSYIESYQLQGVQTMLRGTLRNVGYCKAWNVFVKLGLTDDSIVFNGMKGKRFADLLIAFLPEEGLSLKESLRKFMGIEYDSKTEEMLGYLELFGDKVIEIDKGTPAQILQSLLEEKWKLNDHDKDMIVLKHEFGFTKNGKEGKIESSLGLLGKDNDQTAMAQTVGLPLAICVKNFLTNKIKSTGIQIPTTKEIYIPLLAELETFGIRFNEKKEVKE
ncbi:MAG: saccharopine dehydrogenase NADP-binding domain-containing protein [Sphingobacteriaceae bacterium]|nr:saccharopine dehydrogenase NADP-binding domain-containing protein [Sphingobacteriaceae bacterium]